MKVINLAIYYLFFSAFIVLNVGETYGSSFGMNNKLDEPSSAYAPVGSDLDYPVYFQQLSNATYHWGIKSIVPHSNVNTYASNSFGLSSNKIADGEQGIVQFTVSDLKSRKIIGFTEVTEITASEDIKAAIKQDEERFYLIVDENEVYELEDIAIGVALKLETDNGDINLYVGGELKYTESFTWNGDDLHIGVSFGNSIASFKDLSSNFPLALDIEKVIVSEEGFDKLGALSFTLKNDPTAFAIWGEGDLLSASEFSTRQAQMGGVAITYSDYKKGFPLTKSSLNHGTYPVSIVDDNGNKLALTVAVPSEQRWVNDEHLSIASGEIEKRSGGNSWSTGTATSDNVIHPDSDAKFHFQFNQSGKGAVGLRKLDSQMSTDYSSINYGYYLEGNKLTPIHNGELLTANVTEILRTDYIGIEVKNGTIHFQINGADLLQLEEGLEYKSSIDVMLFSEWTRFGEFELIGIPRWPIMELEQTASVCGKITQLFSLNINHVLLPSDAHIYNYTWRNENGNVVSSSMELKDVPPGLYKLTYSVVFSNGTGQSYISPTAYLVGYKAFWETTEQVEHVPTTNSIRNTLETYNNNIHTGLTSNYLNPGIDEWVYFEIQDPIDGSGNVSFPTYYDRNYRIDLESYGGIGHLSASVYYFGGSSPALVLSDGSGTSLFSTSVSTGDKVWINILGGNQLKLNVNGQDVNSVNGNLIESFNGITTPSIIGFGTSFYSASNFTTKIGPANVITSFPCADMTYLNLKRRVDASYYPARLNAVGFRYLEEYLPATGILNYRILDRK